MKAYTLQQNPNILQFYSLHEKQLRDTSHVDCCVFCYSGGMPSNRITSEFSKWASDGELDQDTHSKMTI